MEEASVKVIPRRRSGVTGFLLFFVRKMMSFLRYPIAEMFDGRSMLLVACILCDTFRQLLLFDLHVISIQSINLVRKSWL